MYLPGAVIQNRTRPGCAEPPTLGQRTTNETPSRVTLLFQVKRPPLRGDRSALAVLGTHRQTLSQHRTPFAGAVLLTLSLPVPLASLSAIGRLGGTGGGRLQGNMLTELIATLAGVLLLSIFFRSVKTQWPESYASVGQGLEELITSNPVSYALFRFAPVFLTCSFMGSVLYNNQLHVVLPVLGIAFGHAILTSGRASRNLIRSGNVKSQPLVTVFHVIIALAVVLCAVASLAVIPQMSEYVPTGRELGTSLWTALFAAVAGAFLVALTKSPDGEGKSEAFHRSRQRIPEEVWAESGQMAEDCGSDADLVHAIMLVEGIQRPRWVQALETMGGRVFGRGSYGPLQVTSGTGESYDTKALTRDIRKRFSGQRRPLTEHGVDRRWLSLFLRSYNPNPQWQSDVEEALGWLKYQTSNAMASTYQRAKDGLPTLEVKHFARQGGGLILNGTSGTSEAIYLIQRSSDGLDLQIDVMASEVGPTGRTDWSGIPSLAPGAVLAIVATTPHPGSALDATSAVALPLLPLE